MMQRLESNNVSVSLVTELLSMVIRNSLQKQLPIPLLLTVKMMITMRLVCLKKTITKTKNGLEWNRPPLSSLFPQKQHDQLTKHSRKKLEDVLWFQDDQLCTNFIA